MTPKDPAKPTPTPRFQLGGSTALRNAAVFTAVMIGVFTVQYFRVILTPLIIALFLLLLIDGSSRKLADRFPNWPGWLRSTLGATLTIAGFSLVVGICVQDWHTLTTQLEVLQPKIDALLAEVSGRLHIEPISARDLFKENPSVVLGHLFGAARGVLSEAVLVIIYLGFLMASRQAFGRKADRLFVGAEGRDHADRVFSRVRNASEQYVGLQTVKAALVAVIAFLIMTGLGVHGALFLSLLLFLAAYVPIVGGIVGTVIPGLIALAQFESPVRPLALVILLGAAIFLLDNVLMPKLQGDRLNLDPVVILLSLGLWAIVLGLPGALLSTPLTVVVLVVASEFPGTRWLARLLSKEGELASE